jgi:lysophospholipase L1-like esterase
MKTKNNKGSKLWITVSIVLLLICILLTATLGVLYVKKATPQRLLSKLGFHFPEETNWTLESWNSSLEQLDYDSDIVFIGDSLTRGENFQEYFPNKKIINLGISGDSLSGISKRAFIISELTPEMIFVEGGVNSLGSNSVDSLAAQYESMIAEIIANNPGDEVFIQSILPISNKNQTGGLTNENIVKLNAKLQEIAERQGVTYIDVYSVYVLNGEMNPEYTKDGVHLKDEYKYLWLDVLAEYVNK